MEDDGVSLNSEISLKLSDILAKRQFGLAGMYERASLIGADISIYSKPNQGARIQVNWKPKETT